MDENDSIDYKALYEKTKKDMKTLKSYAKNSMNTETSNLVQIKLLVQLLEEVYDRCDSASPKPNYMEISSESYDVIKRCTFDAIDATKKGSILSSTSAAPMNAAMLKSLETDVAAKTGRTTPSSETPLYTEKEMSLALKSLRDDIIRTCEKEARSKLHQLQTKCGEIQYAHDLLGLELSELRGAGGQLCSECGELVKDKTTPPSSDDQSSITSNNTGKVKAAAGVQRSQAGAVRTKSVWVEYYDPNLPDPAVPGDEQPIPFGGLHSPVIERLLNEWTDDHNKIMYLVSWVEGLSKLEILPEAFPRGLQIVEVNTMVRDGFLMLLLPLMRYMSLHKLVLFTRTAGAGADLESEALFDIRIKVLNEANEYYHPSASPSASRQTSVESSGPEAGLGRRPSSDILAGPKAGLNSVFQNTVSGVFTLVNITQQSLGALATMSGALIPPVTARSVNANGTTIPAKSGPISESPHQPTPDSTRVAADMATPASAPSGGSDAAPVSVVSQWATFLGTKVIGGMSGIPNPVLATSVGVAETKPRATTEKSTFVAPTPTPAEAAVPASLAAAPVDGAVNATGPEDLSLASPSPVDPIAAPSVVTEAAPVVSTSSEGGTQLSAKDKMNAKLAALRQKSSKK